MIGEPDLWTPGSFTKNFSWGPRANGLSALHELIRVGFANDAVDVPRAVFRERVRPLGRPDFIAINFFLFNKPQNGVDHILADELVFQAVNFEPSVRFDALAVFALNLSLAGTWRGQRNGQRRPAMWANHYIRDRVAREYGWNTERVSANDIEAFVTQDSRYWGDTSRKLSTNLNYLYRVGRLDNWGASRINRYWVDAIFLALDRGIEERKLDGAPTLAGDAVPLLSSLDFLALTGGETTERKLGLKHVVALYHACGGLDRLSEDLVMRRTRELLPAIHAFLANDPRPRGAVHRTNPRILKSIPRACAMLAREMAGFYDLDPDQLESFDLENFVRERTRDALERMKDENIKPIMSAAELAKLTREK